MCFHLKFGAHHPLRDFKEGRAGYAAAYLLKQNNVLVVEEGTIISAET
jgi:hypothetical protein